MEGYAKFVVVALLLAIVIGDATRVAKGMTICGVNRDELYTCLPAAAAGNPAPPSPACCKATARANLQCLCSYRNSDIVLALGINLNEAMKVPAKCNVNPTFRCN
ncbi:hypothetical protein Ancab_018138 [Ancistrocladus abbreviatus]